MKNKYLRNTLITVGIYLLVIFFEFFVRDSVIAVNSGDYLNQHTIFIDYIRRNFWASGDFFPQWNMNYGLGQSFVTMYYHGMYNPFVMLSYVLPPINPVFIFEIIFAILLGLNTLGMTKLLELNNIEGRLNTVISILSSFSGVFLHHFTEHPMFIYYLPIMVFSLISLHYLVDAKVKSYYAITVGLIFFTNFTFAPIISVLQFLYFTGLLVDAKKFNIKSYVQYFLAYLVGVLSGMLILVPTELFVMLSSARIDPLKVKIPLLTDYKTFIYNIGANPYSSGIFIIGMMAILGTLFITRKRRYIILLIPMLLILIFPSLNYTFNLFQYIHRKVYIMNIPIWWLMFAETVKRGNKSSLGLLTLVSTFLFILPLRFEVTISQLVFLIICAILIYLLCITERKAVTIIICTVLIIGNFNAYITLCSRSELDIFTNANGEMSAGIVPYREIVKANNHLDNVYSLVPYIYTSLENYDYVKAARQEFEVPTRYQIRNTTYPTFENMYLQNLYAVKNDDVDVNPIVYGVPKEEIYSLESYNKLDKDQKLYAVNQGLFIEQTKNTNYQDKFSLQPIYSSNKPITISKDQEWTFKIPEQYQNGTLNISFDADLEHDLSQNQRIGINDQVNEVMYEDLYGVNDNSQVTFRITTKDLDELKVKVSMFSQVPITYSNFKVTYQSLDDFEANKIKVVEPTSFIADMNDSYSFDLDMKKDGYLATTIPYDRGFKIYVDGEQVEVEKLEDLFIGAKLPAGNHKITIKYNIPGFKVGLGLTICGWILIGYLFITERLKIKKQQKNNKIV